MKSGLARKPLAQIGKKDPKCRVCTRSFKRERVGQPVCQSYACMSEWVKRQQVKKACAPYRGKSNKKTPEQRAARANDKSHQMELTQRTVNRWVVHVRDAGLPCFTCDFVFGENKRGGVFDCGHYKTVGAHIELRYEVRQLAKQCISCNRDNGGRPDEFRKRLIVREGIEYVEWLEGPHEMPNWTCDWLREHRAQYSKLIREAGI